MNNCWWRFLPVFTGAQNSDAIANYSFDSDETSVLLSNVFTLQLTSLTIIDVLQFKTDNLMWFSLDRLLTPWKKFSLSCSFWQARKQDQIDKREHAWCSCRWQGKTISSCPLCTKQKLEARRSHDFRRQWFSDFFSRYVIQLMLRRFFLLVMDNRYLINLDWRNWSALVHRSSGNFSLLLYWFLWAPRVAR